MPFRLSSSTFLLLLIQLSNPVYLLKYDDGYDKNDD